jgi:chromate transporter
VSALTIYLLILKATVMSFAGMGSLPQVREDFVVTRQVISDEQLSQSVLVSRSTPGPLGAYVVGVGYLAGGWPGAVAGWLALVTPAFIMLPLLATVRRWLHVPRVRAAVDAIVVSSAVLLMLSGVRMALEGLRVIAGG